jgi:release factor glutamine methyltransferase
VPRSHSELLARRATELLAPSGAAIDACTGCGAIAVVLRAERPGADVIATELDEAAARCATLNGVEVHRGDLLAPVPATWRGATDLVVAVVPYVPTPSLHLLQRDTFAFEGPEAYDGGDDGLALLRRIATEARTVLRPGGALLLELGGDQAEPFAAHLGALGYVDIVELVDDEGDTRGVEARRPPPP